MGRTFIVLRILVPPHSPNRQASTSLECFESPNGLRVARGFPDEGGHPPRPDRDLSNSRSWRMEKLMLSSSSLYEGLFMMGRTSIVGLQRE